MKNMISYKKWLCCCIWLTVTILIYIITHNNISVYICTTIKYQKHTDHKHKIPCNILHVYVTHLKPFNFLRVTSNEGRIFIHIQDDHKHSKAVRTTNKNIR